MKKTLAIIAGLVVVLSTLYLSYMVWERDRSIMGLEDTQEILRSALLAPSVEPEPVIVTETIVEYVEIPVIETVTKEVPVEVVKEVIKEVPVEVIREVEVPVEKVVETTVEIPVLLKDWESEEELIAFLADDDSDHHLYIRLSADGSSSLENQCEDRAIRLIDNAQGIGKRLFFIPLHPAEYKKWYGEARPENHYHAICGALVGDNGFYYIEPSDDRVWLAQNLD